MAQSKLVSQPNWGVRPVGLGRLVALAAMMVGLVLVVAVAIEAASQQAAPRRASDHGPTLTARPRPSRLLGDPILIPVGVAALVAVACRRPLTRRRTHLDGAR